MPPHQDRFGVAYRSRAGSECALERLQDQRGWSSGMDRAARDPSSLGFAVFGGSVAAVIGGLVAASLHVAFAFPFPVLLVGIGFFLGAAVQISGQGRSYRFVLIAILQTLISVSMAMLFAAAMLSSGNEPLSWQHFRIGVGLLIQGAGAVSPVWISNLVLVSLGCGVAAWLSRGSDRNWLARDCATLQPEGSSPSLL